MKNYKNYIIAILLIIGGIYLVIKPNMTFQNLIFYVGLIMLIVGISKVLVSITSSLSILMPGSYFLSGGLTALFGLILMLNKSSAVNIVPKIIGAWLIITSLSSQNFLAQKSVATMFVLAKFLFSKNSIPLKFLSKYAFKTSLL